MLAARNKHFRLAAALGAVSYLILAVRDTFEANTVIGGYSPGEFKVASAIFVGTRVIGAFGFVVVAVAFGDPIDWPRLRGGGTILASVFLAFFVAWIFRVIGTLPNVDNVDYRSLQVWSAAAALLFAAAAGAIVSSFVDSRRGTARANLIWIGAILLTASYAVVTVAQLYQQSFYSSLGYDHAFTIGTMVIAFASLGTALAVLVFVLGARRPLPRREGALFAALAGATVAGLVYFAGSTLIAIGVASHGGTTSGNAEAWLTVVGALVSTAMTLAAALGARAVWLGSEEPTPA